MWLLALNGDLDLILRKRDEKQIQMTGVPEQRERRETEFNVLAKLSIVNLELVERASQYLLSLRE